MGEATYYFKAKFSSVEKAEEAFPAVQAFLLEGAKAHDYWQDHRDMEKEHRVEFWTEFKAKFPIVTKYLNGHVDGDCNNELAGQLDFGEPEDVENHLQVEGREIWYHATVWHFAVWGALASFLVTEFGALHMNHLSDEYIEPFDLL